MVRDDDVKLGDAGADGGKGFSSLGNRGRKKWLVLW